VRISADQRQQNEARIRTAMDRLLRGQIPPGGKCDIKTLAREALLTELSREFPQVNWRMASSAVTVPDHDRKW